MSINGIAHQAKNVRATGVKSKSVEQNQANVSQQRVAQNKQAIKDELVEFYKDKYQQKDGLVAQKKDVDEKYEARRQTLIFAGLTKEQILKDKELVTLLKQKKYLDTQIKNANMQIEIKKNTAQAKLELENKKLELTNQVMNALNGGEVSFNSRSSLGKALKGKEVVDVKFSSMKEVQQKKGFKTETGFPAEITLENGQVLKALVHYNKEDRSYEIHGMKK